MLDAWLETFGRGAPGEVLGALLWFTTGVAALAVLFLTGVALWALLGSLAGFLRWKGVAAPRSPK